MNYGLPNAEALGIENVARTYTSPFDSGIAAPVASKGFFCGCSDFDP
jgi:hypothetical protein